MGKVNKQNACGASANSYISIGRKEDRRMHTWRQKCGHAKGAGSSHTNKACQQQALWWVLSGVTNRVHELLTLEGCPDGWEGCEEGCIEGCLVGEPDGWEEGEHDGWVVGQ
jgi:hypothetical protein